MSLFKVFALLVSFVRREKTDKILFPFFYQIKLWIFVFLFIRYVLSGFTFPNALLVFALTLWDIVDSTKQ